VRWRDDRTGAINLTDVAHVFVMTGISLLEMLAICCGGEVLPGVEESSHITVVSGSASELETPGMVRTSRVVRL
jgi:hypothetical protein